MFLHPHPSGKQKFWMQFIHRSSVQWRLKLRSGASFRLLLGFGAEPFFIDCVATSLQRRLAELGAMAGSTGATVVKDVVEDPKLDVFEDDDEFEEFENEVWDDEDEGKGALQQWEDDWDDDDVTDDFSVQLKKELETEN